MAKLPRQKKQELPALERIHTVSEVTKNYTEVQALTEATRCLQCKKPTCVPGCPVNIKIPQFIKKITEKDFFGALEVIKQDNDLPAVCGRVCPQERQCEGACILHKTKQEPVGIGNLERFVADYARENKLDSCKVKRPKNNKRVAIIGSGPAGLACAGDLIALGFEVTVFEALHELGGVLSYGIPEFRLPKNILQHEIQALAEAGVVFKKNHVIGKIKTIPKLLAEGFAAVYIASGAGFPSFMNIPGEDLNGVYSANEYLTRLNLMRAYHDFAETPIKKLSRIAIVGGGNVAMDSARWARRMGAETYLIYRRSKAEMPARIEEVEHAEQEGINFLLLSNPTRFIGNEQGNVLGVEIQKMTLGEPDSSGRRRPEPQKGSEYVLDIDAAIIAIGTQANPIIADTTPGLQINKYGYITTDEVGRTSLKGVYAGGDIVSGAATVIEAMGAGKKTAQTIFSDLS